MSVLRVAPAWDAGEDSITARTRAAVARFELTEAEFNPDLWGAMTFCIHRAIWPHQMTGDALRSLMRMQLLGRLDEEFAQLFCLRAWNRVWHHGIRCARSRSGQPVGWWR